jgi:hypothetical protein
LEETLNLINLNKGLKMDEIIQVKQWVDNLLYVFLIAKAIVVLTPTPRDDYWYGQIYKFVELLALNIGKAKFTAPNRPRT